MPTKPRSDPAVVPLDVLRSAFELHLRAANKAPRTVESYLASVDHVGAYLRAQGMPTSPAGIRREHIEAYLADLMARGYRPASVAVYYRSLRVFFGYLVDEGEITVSPMARMRAPAVPETPPPLLHDDELLRLLKTCDGKDFASRRDLAILFLLLDSGMRRSELAGLTVNDLDFEHRTAMVMGKGRRPRACPFEFKTAECLHRYVRERSKRKDADRPELWLGLAGPLTSNGIYQAVKSRAGQAGLKGVFPHLFRHQFAHAHLAAGGNETDLMQLAGWRSRVMLDRYGSSAATERALAAHHSLSLVDRLVALEASSKRKRP